MDIKFTSLLSTTQKGIRSLYICLLLVVTSVSVYFAVYLDDNARERESLWIIF